MGKKYGKGICPQTNGKDTARFATISGRCCKKHLILYRKQKPFSDRRYEDKRGMIAPSSEQVALIRDAPDKTLLA